MAALPVLDTPQIGKGVTHGLSATLVAGLQGVDTLCCGAMGRVEALVVASKELRDFLFLRHAHKIASFVLRLSTDGTVRVVTKKNTLHCIVSARDVSELASEFLRLASPDSLPSLLLWE
jgi:lantibiotic modifying enzyme